MRILIISQHFPPERGAVRRLFEFARYFVRQGHEVSVLTAIPNYPDGEIPPRYRGRFYFYEEMDGVKVHRSWTLPASNRQRRRRMFGFLVFSFTCLFTSFRIRPKPDVVLASMPPVNTPVIGWLISRMRRSRFVIEVRDLEPEACEFLGNLKPSLFTRSLKRIIHGLYRRADKIVAVTDGLADYLKALGIRTEKVTTIKSGFGDEFLEAAQDHVRERYGWNGRFLVLYSGTLGRAHALETIIESARRLESVSDLLFVMVGDGERRTALEQMTRAFGLRNVAFLGAQPLERIPGFLKTADILVEALRNTPITSGIFPAKLFEYMASGRPILFGARDGEAIRELRAAGGVLSFASDDVTKLCELILKIKDGTIDGDALGRRYSEHAQRFHRRERWAKDYLAFLVDHDQKS
jgi:colanic acid biosynthesis glycosyl transferase WcaI